MKTLMIVALMSALLSTGAVTAAENKPGDKADPVERKADKAEAEDIEARLKEARERLQQAAKEVAELSGRLAGPVADRLMVFRGEPRALIGVQLDPASGKEGARVVAVSPGGAAEEAGVRAGDLIVSLNGTSIASEKSAREVTQGMRDIEPNSKLKLRVMRDGKPKDFEILARPAPSVGFFTGPPAPGIPLPEPPPGLDGQTPSLHNFVFRFNNDELSGLELATLTPGLGRYFGTDKGVLVVRAPERDAFKLQDGDVILSIDGREPTSGSHATRILRSYQPGEKIGLKLMRQHKATNVQVTLPEPQKLRASPHPTVSWHMSPMTRGAVNAVNVADEDRLVTAPTFDARPAIEED